MERQYNFKITQNVNQGVSGSLLKLLRDFLSERRQCVVLNSQVYTWTIVTAGVPQGSILGYYYLTYIHDLSEERFTNSKSFADDTPLFSVSHDSQTSVNHLNKDLDMIYNWASHWKVKFNPDPTKQS